MGKTNKYLYYFLIIFTIQGPGICTSLEWHLQIPTGRNTNDPKLPSPLAGQSGIGFDDKASPM